MHATWRTTATAVGMLALAALPLLAMTEPMPWPGRAAIVVVPLGSACAAAAAGFWSRPPWLALAASLLGIATVTTSLVATSDPCGFECFPPQATALVAGAFLIWPWQLLGVVTGGLAAHVRRDAGRRRDAGDPRPWAMGIGSLVLYLAAGLALAWFVLGALQ